MNLHPSHRAHLERRHARILRNTERLMSNYYRAARVIRRLRHWAKACQKLELKLWPFPPPTPEEAAEFRAEQEGRT